MGRKKGCGARGGGRGYEGRWRWWERGGEEEKEELWGRRRGLAEGESESGTGVEQWVGGKGG